MYAINKKIKKNQTRKSVFFGAFVIVGVLFSVFSFYSQSVAAPNYQMNYQGKLTDASGVAVVDGTYNIRFWLLTSPTAPTSSAIWTESLTGSDKVQVTDGLFSIMLGSTSPLTGVDFNQTLYLGVEIGGSTTPAWDGEMSPRKILGTVPAAFEAKNASTVGGVASTSLLRSDQAGTASGLLTFTNGIISQGSSTIFNLTTDVATTTRIVINGDSFTDLTGTSLTVVNGALSVATSTFFTDSAQFAQWLSDETGSGNVVFSASPTFTGTVGFASLTTSGSSSLSYASATALTVSGNSIFNFASSTYASTTGLTATNAYINAFLGIGSTSPNASLAIRGTGTTNPFTIASSSGSSLLTLSATGRLLVGTTTNADVYGNYFGGTTTLRGVPTALRAIGAIDNTASIANMPRVIASPSTGGTGGYSITLSGEYAYVVNATSETLSVLDISRPISTVLVSTTSVPGVPHSVAISGQYAYTANSASGSVSVLDISNPYAPIVVTTVDVGEYPNTLVAAGRYVYVVNSGSNTLSVLDISNPRSPVTVAEVGTEGAPAGIYVTDQYAYVTNSASNTLSIIDISNPRIPTTVATTTTGSAPQTVQVIGGYAYVANYLGDSVSIINITNPSVPAVSATVALGSVASPLSLAVSGRYVYVPQFGTDRLSVIDVASTTAPVLVSSTSVGVGTDPLSIAILGRYAYLVNSDSLSVVDLSGIESTAILAHSLEAGNLSIRNNSDIAGLLHVGGALTIGNGGFFSQGNSSVFGSFAVGTTTSSLLNADVYQSRVAIGTTSPWAKLSIQNTYGSNDILFDVATTTSNSATSSLFTILANGNVGIGTTTPGRLFSVAGSAYFSDLILGNNLTTNSLSVLSSSTLAYASATALTVSGQTYLGYASTTGISATNANVTNAVVGELTLSTITGSTQCLQVNSSGVVSGSGSACGTGSGSGAGSWATTTSLTSGQAINYSLSDTDIIAIGSNSTTSAEFWFDPNNATAYISGSLGIGTTTPGRLLSVAGSGYIGDLTLGQNLITNSLSVLSSSTLAYASATALTVSGNSTFNFASSSYASTTGLTANNLTVANGSIASLGIGTTISSTTGPRLEVLGDIVSKGTEWTLRTSTTTQGWTSVAYGNGIFVAVAENGSNGRVMTSPDGINWTARTGAGDNAWRSVTYGNGRFVAVATSGGSGPRIMTSIDGINWSYIYGVTNRLWTSITYGNGLFVVVGETAGVGNHIITSPDGITWTARTAAADNSWYSVTYGNGLFVAVSVDGSGNRVMTSPDGITWTSRTSAADNYWWSVTYGNGMFVAVSDTQLGTVADRVMTSPDGINWTARTAVTNNDWYSVTYGNGLFVAVANSGSGNRVMTSPDGIAWTTRSTSGIDKSYIGVTYGNGLFVAIANSGTGQDVMTSGKADYSLLAHNNTYQGGASFLGGPFNIGTTTPTTSPFATNVLNIASTTGTSLLTLTNAGYLGIGTTTPGRLLSVAGSGYMGDLTLGQNLTTNSLSVLSSSTLAYASATALTVSGNTFLSYASSTGLSATNLTLTGNSVLGYASATALTVSGNSIFNFASSSYASTTGLTATNAYINNFLSIGSSTPGSTLTIVGNGLMNPFSVASSSGSSLLTLTTDGKLLVGTTTNAAVYGNYFGGTTTLNGSTASPLALDVRGNIQNVATSGVSPRLVATTSVPGNAAEIEVVDKYAYITDSSAGVLRIFDVSDALSPTLISSTTVATTSISDILVNNQILYAVTNTHLVVVNIANPATPIVMSTTPIRLSGGLKLVGTNLYAFSSGGLASVDIKNPYAPNIVSIATLPTSGVYLEVSGNYAYVGGWFVDKNLTIVDISNPRNMTVVAATTTYANISQLAVQGRYLYIGSYSPEEFGVIDISNPASPVTMGRVELSGPFDTDLVISGRYAFVGESNSGVRYIIDIASATRPTRIHSVGGSTETTDLDVEGRYLYSIDNAADALFIHDLGGIETTAALAHSLEAGNALIRKDLTTMGNLSVGRGLTIGNGGLLSQGAGAFNVTASTSLAGVSALSASMSDNTTNSILDVLSLSRGATGTAAAGIGTGILFSAQNDAGTMATSSRIASLFTTTTNGAETSALTFSNRTAGGALTEYMRIDGSGNVGIGTTTPGRLLSVAGSGYMGDLTLGQNLTTNSLSVLSSSTLAYASATALTVSGNTFLSYASSTGLSATNLTLTGNSVLGYASATALTVSGNSIFNFASSSYASTTGLTATNAYINNFLSIGSSTPGSALTVQNSDTSDYIAQFRIFDSSSTGGILVSGQSAQSESKFASVENTANANNSGLVNVIMGGPGNVAAYNAAIHSSSGSKNLYSLIGQRRTNTGWYTSTINALTQGDYLPGIGFAGQSNTTAGTGMVIGASIQGIVDNTVSSLNLPTALVFHTGASSTALFERMRISSSGNVGIGTTSPTSLLYVQGTSSILTTNLFSVASSTGTSLFTINSNGNVGIGTTTPTQLLSVAGGFQLTGGLYDTTYSAGTSGYVLQTTGTGVQWVATSSLGISGGTGDGVSNWITANGALTPSTTLGLRVNASTTIGDGSTTGGLTVSGSATTTNLKVTSLTASRALFTDADNLLTTTGVSQNLSDSLSDETGTGNLVFSVSPTFTGTAAFASLTTSGSSSLGYASATALTVSGNTYLTYASTTALSGVNLALTGNAFLTYASATALTVSGNSIFNFASSSYASTTGLTATNAYFGRVGIGTSTPAAELGVAGTVLADRFIAASTTATSSIAGNLSVGDGNIFYNASTTVTSISALELGNLAFDSDAGIISWINLPVTAVSATGTVQSYSAQIADQSILTVYGEANGQTGINNAAVGVGTSTPTATFMVQGNGTNNPFIVASSTGTSLLKVLASGNVGIGTTTPGRLLSVAGSGYMGDLTLGQNLTTNSLSVLSSSTLAYASATALTVSGQTYLGYASSTGLSATNVTATNSYASFLGLGTTSPYATLALQGSGTTNPFSIASSSGASMLTVHANGNVGIGTATPSYALHVKAQGTAGSAIFESACDGCGRGMYVYNKTNQDNSSAGINFALDNNSGALSTYGAVSGIRAGNVAGYLGFSTLRSGSLTEAMRLDNVGNLGIGTTTPGRLLSVAGDATISGLLTTNGFSALGSTSLAYASATALTVSGNSIFNFASSSYASTTGLTATNAYVLSALGVGTTTPFTLLTLDKAGITSPSIAGIKQTYAFANGTQSTVSYGNEMYITSVPTATSTLVGSIIRIADTSALGNTVRTFEAQAHRGTNTKGENTGLSGFGRTFGVRGTTIGDAGSVYLPAGVFAETEGTTQGNALRAYSGTITTENLVSFFQDSSAFSGTGLVMNFGNAGGSFAPTSTAKFADLQIAGTSRFTITAGGTTTIGATTSTETMAGLQIVYGGLCVDNDGSCTASTSGRITSVSSATGNSDLAEIYFSNQALRAGEIVALNGGLSIARANRDNKDAIIGVVSTKPGLLLGFDDTSLIVGEEGYPVGLKGRVPIKLSTENGPIKKGDKIMLSSIPGIGMKATASGTIVGTALEDFEGEHAYSEGFLNQFGDDMVRERIIAKEKARGDLRAQDGCTYGGGNALGEKACVKQVVTSHGASTTIIDTTREDALRELQEEEPLAMRTDDGKNVQVGQALMFIELEQYMGDPARLALDELVAPIDDTEETLWSRLKKLATNFVKGVLTLTGIKTDKVETKELCVDDVCVTADDLRALINQARNTNEGDQDTNESESPEEENTEENQNEENNDEEVGEGVGPLPEGEDGGSDEGEDSNTGGEDSDSTTDDLVVDTNEETTSNSEEGDGSDSDEGSESGSAADESFNEEEDTAGEASSDASTGGDPDGSPEGSGVTE
jgi:YVTN family beta-propeller protein